MGFNTYPVNPFPQSSDQAGSGESGGGLTPEQEALIESVPARAYKANIAPDFSDLTNYNAGDLVYYEDKLYQFSVDHTAGPWESSEAIEKDLSDIINSGGSGGSGEVIYSTTEREIGTWINGKTLYEKTFVCKSGGVDQLTYANSAYAIDVTDMDDAFVYAVMARRTAQYQSKYIDSYNVTGEIQTVIDTTGAIYFPYASRFDDIIVTLRYTKTETEG